MSNPFDQFTTDVSAALPPVSDPYGGMQGQPPPFGAPPPPAAGPPFMPTMTAPQPPPPPQYGYGAPPPPPAYGQPPPPPPPPAEPAYDQNPFGGMGGGAPPSMAPPMPQPPAPPMSDPYGGGYGQPPMPTSMPMTAPEAYPPSVPAQVPPPAPDASANPFAGMAESSVAPPAPAYEAPAMNGGGQYADPWGSPGGGAAPPVQPPAMQSGYAAGPPPFGGPPGPPPVDAGAPPFGAPPPQPYGMDPTVPPPQDYGMGGGGALVVADQQMNPYAQPPQANPYGQPPPNPYGNPYGQQAPYGGYAPQPPPPPPVDPFSVFESAPAPAFETAIVPAAPSVLAPTNVAPPVSDDEFWGSFAPNTKEDSPPPKEKEEKQVEEEKKGEDGLPPGGEWYDARIFTPTLGVMFFKPQELTDSLFLNTDKSIVDALGERPVVAFIVEGSSARSAGVELGHVLLKVNGVDVKNPKEASRLIKEGPRPLPLLFYVPTTDVVVAEGEHMVKYDTKETTAPNSAKDWKPKYVVIGGIISQPWMMNMYRSKSEYDIAVIETQARRPVSVKVKQFSLQGARIQNDWQGPQMVKYKNKLHPWKYIVVLPVARNPIKISSPNLAQLKPVHEGIRRVLLAQQRGRAGPSRERESYERHGRDQQSSRSDQSYDRDRRSSERSSYDDRAPSSRDSHGGDSYGGSSYGPPVTAGDPYGGGYAQPQQQAYRY